MMTEPRNPVVLIVDDVMENIQVVATHLRHEGYELLFATDGLAALDVVAEGEVDLILLDVMMPNLNGFDTCTRIKQRPETAEIPVIFLTAKTDTDSIVKGFSVGGIDYITKPFKSEELLARVRTHLRLRRSELELREMMAAKDRFLSIIADELNAPFQGLRGMLAMLSQEWRELQPEELDEYLRMADSTAENVSGLLDNLLSWARLQSGLFGYHPRPIPLADLVEEATTLYYNELQHKGIVLQTQIDPALTLPGDPDMLQKVFENLLSNAIKYSHHGGSVEVTAETDATHATLRISDHGTGIPVSELPAIFQLDRRCLKPGTAGETGSGLGLLLSRALVEQHGGSILLANHQEETGLEVKVTLPLHIQG